MAFTVQPHFTSLEHRPKLLKDFLRDDASHSCTPSPWSTVALSSKSNKPHIVLLRNWSKRATATKISAVHKVIKLLQFASMKSPSVLPRSISRKLTKRGKDDNDIIGDVSEVKVKVKDILRWKSFRDLTEDDSAPLDYPLSPTTTSCSKRSSWCDSDFTAEELPPWRGEKEELSWGKNAATLKNSKGDWSFEEYEQRSPVSVLDSPFRQVQEFISPFHPTAANNVQRTKFGHTRRNLELSFEGEAHANSAEEKAKQLVGHVTEEDDGVILDFFTRELSMKGKLDDDEFDREILRIAKSWMEGELEESYEWEVEENRESYVKEMEKGVSWNKFREEQEELCKELEIRVLNDLLDDAVADFLA